MAHGTSRRSFLLLGGAAIASALAGCGSDGTATWQGGSAGASGAPSGTPSSKPTAASGKPVHVSLLNGDGDVRGVGMPIVAWFNVKPTDVKAFNAATKVTVDGQPVEGNWFFEETAHRGSKMEAHWRPQEYWPAHAKIHMDLPVKGLSAGDGLVFDDSLTLDMSTGAAYIGTIDAEKHTMTVTKDGQPFATYPVSLGAVKTPTAHGIKVIMEKGLDIEMKGPGYDDPHVKFTQRLTYGGEYLHSAPWNVKNIGHRNTSNGCTNLRPADAEKLYHTFEIGDVFEYPNADGPAMTLGAGYGDWNLDWETWQTGGALKV